MSEHEIMAVRADSARAALAGTPHERLDAAVRTVDAPDVVFAMSVQGHRTVRASPGAEGLRYELGSASKTYTGLLLARLARTGHVAYDDPAAACFGSRPPRLVAPITLRHLITHTSGLPVLPRDFYRQALPRWSTNPFAGYPAHRVVDAFLGARPRHRPGTRWHYSNFGVSVLGHALGAATRTGWDALMEEQVLAPLGLAATTTRGPGIDGIDAVGHAKDGVREVPPLRIGGFAAAGAVRATPHDMLTFLEAHLRPERTPSLADALHAVRRPVLRRGLGKAHTHTLTWFQHPTDDGPAYFHGGATSGQQAFLGFCPGTGTAVAAVASRRFRRSDAFVPTAYGVLFGPA